MSGILVKDKAEPEAPDRNLGGNETIEKSALRRIIRENWKGKIAANDNNPEMAKALDDHAMKMEQLLGTFDYGAICMPHIIANTKKMTQKELINYLALLESLGTGYKHWFNSEFASIFLAGLTLKARDTKSTLKHLEMFLSAMDKKLSYYKTRADRENRSLEGLIQEFEKKDSGLLRFFRGGETRLLKRMIISKTRRLKTLHKKRERYSGIIVRTKSRK